MTTFDPTKPVTTRSGRAMIILTTNAPGLYPIIAMDAKFGSPSQHTAIGKFYIDSEADSPSDLINIPDAPKLRAWKPEEVPAGALLRAIPAVAAEKGGQSNMRSIILCASDRAITHCAGGEGMSHKQPDWYLEHLEHSTDGGATWLRCGVLTTE